MITFKKKILVTSALPYVNNVPHLGTLVPVLSADVYARFLRMKGDEVVSVLGTDEHGTTTEAIAIKMGLTPKEATDHFYKIHKDTYEWFNCSFDCFGRTSSKENVEITQDIFLKLHKNGYIVENEEEQMYDEEAEKFLSDRFIEGTCPYCGFSDARGDQCDNCGKLLSPVELKNPRSKLTGSKPVMRKTKHLYIKLQELQSQLEKHFEEKRNTWSENAISTTQAWFSEGLRERAITRDLKWGIPVPLEGYEDKVFYVWFDAPIGYIAITKEFRQDWKDLWHNPNNVRLVQFLGKDNIPFHSVLFPASLIGADDNYTLVDTMDVNEYLNYEGDKFSKSRGIGIFGDNAMETGIDADQWRYYIMVNRPEKTDSNFTWKDFQDKINSELAGNLGNLVNRTLTFVEKFTDGKINQITQPFVYDDEVDLIMRSYEEVQLKKAIKQIMLLSKKANQYFQEQEPWKAIKEDPQKAHNALAVLVNMIKDISILLHPVMPEISRKIQIQLGMEPNFNYSAIREPLGNHTIGKPQVLFRKLEDSEIEELQKKFSGKQEGAELPQKKVKAGKNPEHTKVEKTVSNNETNGEIPDILSRIDLRVAKIISVEKHPEADKLYIEKLQIGGEERTIVSGLVPYYKKEELEGKNIIIVYNLKPAKLRGVLSKGMLLAAGNGLNVGVLHCPEMEPGDRITFKGIESNPAEEISVDDFFKVTMEAKAGIITAEGYELQGQIIVDKNIDGKVK